MAVAVTIGNGTSTTTLESSAVYRFERKIGEKLFLIRKNEPQKLLMIVDNTHQGKILNISKLL